MVFSAPFQFDKVDTPAAMKRSALNNDALVIDPSPFMIKSTQNIKTTQNSPTKTPTQSPTVTETNLHTLNGIRIPFSPGKRITSCDRRLTEQQAQLNDWKTDVQPTRRRRRSTNEIFSDLLDFDGSGDELFERNLVS